MKKFLPYIVLLAASALVWKAIAMRIEMFEYNSEEVGEIVRYVTFMLMRMAIPAMITAIAMTQLLKRFPSLPRQVFFPLLLVGAIVFTRIPYGGITGAIIMYLTIKHRAQFFQKPVTHQEA